MIDVDRGLFNLIFQLIQLEWIEKYFAIKTDVLNEIQTFEHD